MIFRCFYGCKKYSFVLFFCCFPYLGLVSQTTIVKGSINDAVTNQPIPAATVMIDTFGLKVQTNTLGQFVFKTNLPLGEQLLTIKKADYITKHYPIIVSQGAVLELEGITLNFLIEDGVLGNSITLSDSELNSEHDVVITNISGLLQSSKDVFLNAAAFDFSTAFFKPRGLDSSNSKVLINGLELNKQYSGRPQWSNWGGTNDLQRNQEFSMGTAPIAYGFGDLSGTNNIIMRASSYRKGGRLSIASANKSYTGRYMASYNSGMLKTGWAYSVLVSKRFGNGGYVQGTLYDASSFVASAEKQFNTKHSLNFTGIYANNSRGRGTALTKEVYNIKGRQYNPFWGALNGGVRNSRIKNIEEPILMLNHYWTISDKTSLNTNLGYQFGQTGNTRIDNGGTRLITLNGQDTYVGGARNTDPTYYQNLPSYFLNVDGGPSPYNYEQAYLAEQNLKNDGQFDWDALYRANISSENAIYVLQEDKVDDKQLLANVVFETQINDAFRFSSAINYRKLKSDNYAEVSDLLGGTGYLDVDYFSDESDQSLDGTLVTAQSDVNNPNRIAKKGDRYKYNYTIDANVFGGFAQAEFSYSKIDFYLTGALSNTNYQRNGFFENGYFIGSSLGKGEKVNFINYGFKAGFTYKISGRHLLDFNSAFMTKAPVVKNVFANVRQSNMLIDDVNNEVITSLDVSYIFRSSGIKARLTSFYSKFKNSTQTSFYYSENLGNNLVQEALTGIETSRKGLEFGIEVKVTPTITIKSAGSVGEYKYSNNPNITFYSQEFGLGRVQFGDGKTRLKNYNIPSGPSAVFQLGFQYRDPNYWTIGATINYFSHGYVSPSAVKRSVAFVTDPELYYDGQFKDATTQGNLYTITGNQINAINPIVAKQLLSQEQLGNYALVNLIGGKSWRSNGYYIGFFGIVNNVFNQVYRTGGFEQSRQIDYRSQMDEQTNTNGPIFGNRYFFGNGTTYYLNAYVRF